MSDTAKLFLQCQQLIHDRSTPFFLGHIRAHSGLPGPLSQGNQMADMASKTVAIATNTNLTQAQATHALHHLNAQTLRLMFKITREQARQIVKQCQTCVTHLPVPHLGINPRGLVPNMIWQMDVTHYSEFGNLKYVHVCIDTFSGFILATLQTGEATKHVIAHLLHCFSIVGKPKQLKTDNGPGYTSKAFQDFCLKLQIKHITGIPYNPQGQGIVERAHLSLKTTIDKIKKGEWYPTKALLEISLITHSLF